jgi:hypothetical protein
LSILQSAYQIPPLILDGRELVLGNHGPYQIRELSTRSLIKQKLELYAVFRTVLQVNLAPAELVEDLEEVMAGSETEDRVKGLDSTTARREIELG